MFKFRKDIDFDEDIAAAGMFLKAGIIFVLMVVTFVALVLFTLFWSFWFIFGLIAFGYITYLIDWEETFEIDNDRKD